MRKDGKVWALLQIDGSDRALLRKDGKVWALLQIDGNDRALLRKDIATVAIAAGEGSVAKIFESEGSFANLTRNIGLFCGQIHCYCCHSSN